MRFGVKSAQTSAMLPKDRVPEDIQKYIAEFDYVELVESVAARGFNLLELGGDVALFFPHSFSPASIERLLELKHRRNLSYTVHLPQWSIEPSTPQPPVRAGSVQAVVECIRATLPLEPESYVLHATGTLATEFARNRSEIMRAMVLPLFQASAKQSIRQILQETGIPNRLLAIETIEFPFDLTVQIAEELDISMCLDTGHVLVGFSGPFELFEVLERVLPRLGEVHMHDGPWQGPERNIGYGKDHQPLGQGDLDVGRFLDRLAQANWDGPIVFELSVEQAQASLDRIRSLRPAAVKKS
jgi:sugar phosphate isomerase/epimerase